MKNSNTFKAILLILLIGPASIVSAFTCFGIDEGDAGVCSGNGICVAEDTCSCDVGWMGPECLDSPPSQCFGIEAGDPAVCSGSGVCVDEDLCECYPGYEGPDCSDAPRQCFGIEAGDPAVCSGNGICIDQDTCVCSVGWMGAECLDSPPSQCFGIDAGDPGVCSGNGVCVDDDLCFCYPGYEGPDCSDSPPSQCFGIDADDPVVCSGNGDCVAPDTCVCDPDWEGANCQDYTRPISCSSNSDCGVDSYCVTPAGGPCGGGGTCELRPAACPDVWDPVCGCDGITYDNPCYAANAGVGVAYGGECIIVPSPCFSNGDCDVDSYCVRLPGACEGGGRCELRPGPELCVPIWDPVCGCDGVTYDNLCYAASAGVNVAHGGQCPIVPGPCMSNSDCDVNSYCAKADGSCESNGICESRPGICPFLWDPVCGCDGITYDNSCYAAREGVGVAYGGECLLPPITQCFGIDADDPAVCSGNGDCVEEDTCECQDGYEGDDCSLEPVIFVDVDIKPGSCPNPVRVNFKGNGVISVAILGTEDFDVEDIDVATIALEGVSPFRSSFEDVSTPSDGEDCECTTEGADGFGDLVLKFKRKEVLSALEGIFGDLGELDHKTEVALYLTAQLIDEETTVEGSDCVRLLNRKKRGRGRGHRD